MKAAHCNHTIHCWILEHWNSQKSFNVDLMNGLQKYTKNKKKSRWLFELNSDWKWIWHKYLQIFLTKDSGNNFIFLSAFYLIMWVMKPSKNFGKIAILKIWELISLGCVKTYFGKPALKWYISRHETKIPELILCHSFWFNQDIDTLSTSKWPSELQFCERFYCSWLKNGHKWS